MKKSFSKNIVYPIFYKQKYYRNKGGHNWLSLLQKKLEREVWTTAALEEYQLDRLKKLLIHAGKNVPYYQDLFKGCGFVPERFQDFDELTVLPPLTKEIIAQEGQRLLSIDASQRGVFKNRTSGSTGSPLLFYQDQNYRDHQRVSAWMSDMAAGWRMGDRVARIWGAPQDINKSMKSRANKLINWLLNQQFFNSHQMTDDMMLRYHKELSRVKPDMIVAYSSSAYLLSLFLRSKNLQADYPTKAMITSAEVLHDYMREAIEPAFNTKVFDRYASRDAGVIGYECEQHNGLHVNMQNLYLECVNHGQVEQPGFALITLLENYSMPFIRYQIGDMLVMNGTSCSCGRGAPLIDKVSGRTQDFISLRSGKKFVGEFITHKFLYTNGIKNFQFVQESYDNFVLYIVKGEGFDDTILQEARTKIWQELDKDCQIETIFVDDIPPTAAGKYRTVVSKVPLHFEQ
jgi:phenylacetate-CoA ligase